MDAATSQFVRQRAGNRCEYCRLSQEFSGLRFHDPGLKTNDEPSIVGT